MSKGMMMKQGIFFSGKIGIMKVYWRNKIDFFFQLDAWLQIYAFPLKIHG